jgi:hypothetical protein
MITYIHGKYSTGYKTMKYRTIKTGKYFVLYLGFGTLYIRLY